MQDLTLSGWQVCSAIPLPELSAWRGPEIAPPVCIELGGAPKAFAPMFSASILVQRGRESSCCLRIPGVARYWIMRGQHIIVSPEETAAAADIRFFLLGRVWELLCAQRGLLTLPGACLVCERGAVVLVAPRGAGVSTFAAALALRGYRVLSDDFSILAGRSSEATDVGNDPATALPTLQRLKLWRESLTALKVSTDGLLRTRQHQERYILPTTTTSVDHPTRAPVLRVIVLDRTAKRTRTTGLLSQVEARTRLHKLWQTNYAGVDFGPEPRASMHLDQITARVPVHQFQMGHAFGFASFRHEVERLEEVMDT